MLKDANIIHRPLSTNYRTFTIKIQHITKHYLKMRLGVRTLVDFK